MKKNPFSLSVISFVAGMVLGVCALVLYSFSWSTAIPANPSAVNKISVSDANTLFRNYYDNATATNSVVRGFAINREQLDALNALSSENSGLAGFRIYLGHDNNSGNVGIIVGVDNDGQDVTNSIYRTASGGSGPCPTICDANSGITGR